MNMRLNPTELIFSETELLDTIAKLKLNPYYFGWKEEDGMIHLPFDSELFHYFVD